jgi:hypothetical protein
MINYDVLKDKNGVITLLQPIVFIETDFFDTNGDKTSNESGENADEQ